VLQKFGKDGSLLLFTAFAQPKKLADALSVRFLRAALSISHLQRTAALRPWCRMTQTAHSYWRRWNKRVLTQLSMLTATAQKIVHMLHRQAKFLTDDFARFPYV
jgi:hypothetical protein